MSFKTRKYFFLVCLMVLALAACKVNDDAPGVTTTASINILNLIPDGSSINYYDNGTRENNYKLGYTLGSGYLTVTSGLQTAIVKDTLYANLYSGDITLTKNTGYTLFVAGSVKSGVTGILATDTALSVTNKARVRFINASAGTPAVDVLFNSASITGTAYKAISKFATVDTGTVTVKVNLAGNTPTNLYNQNYKLLGGGVYTFYTYGLYNTTGNTALNVGAIANH